MFKSNLVSLRPLRGAATLHPARPSPRFLSSSAVARSSAGYGNGPTERPNDLGTKKPSSTPDPSGGSSSAKGTTDPELAKKAAGGGQGGVGGNFKADRKEHAVGQGVDAETSKVLGSDQGGKTSAPQETKEVGKGPEKH